MNRLRSRLIAAFLGVAVMAMIPLAVISYYTLQIRYQNIRSQWLENTLNEIGDHINYQSNIPADVLFPLAQYLQERFPQRPDLLEILEYSESLDDAAVREQLNWWEKKLFSNVLDENMPGGNLLLQLNPQLLKQNLDPTRRYRDYPIKILPKKTFLSMKEWLDEGLLYEEDNKLYCYKIQPLLKGDRLSEMETVGALFVKILLIEKFPGDPTRQPDFYIRNKRFEPQPVIMNPQPNIFENYLSEDDLARLFGFPPYQGYREVDVDWVQILSSDVNWPTQFRLAPNYQEGGGDTSTLSENTQTIPMQMKLIPIINHRRELTALMVLGIPIASIVGTIGFALAIGYGAALIVIVFFAVLFSRTISRPIHELATAAQQMADGDFDVRVQAKGTQEQRILGSTFNRLAERIQAQLVQLKQKTFELETSNRELSETHNFLNNILANIRTGVMSVDSQGGISHINSVGESILRVSDWLYAPVKSKINCPAFTNLIAYALQQGVSVQENEIPYEWKGGAIVPLQISIVPVIETNRLKGLVVTFHDLSTIRHLEEQIRRQDRLAALGRMAAGVAHEIRNPLGIIRGSAELLRNRFGGREGEEGLSDFILDEVKRLSCVVNDFLLFARPPEPNREEVSIDFLFGQMSEYFDGKAGGFDYKLILDPGDGVSSIAADMNQCRQVFLNLFINAQQAMPEGGEIVLRARTLSESEIAVEIEDCGEGIPSDRLDKIFDPFYTSKDSGTGLGLSLVHQIVSSHGGRVEVVSNPGKGSIFRLIFMTYDAFVSDPSSKNHFSDSLVSK